MVAENAGPDIFGIAGKENGASLGHAFSQHLLVVVDVLPKGAFPRHHHGHFPQPRAG